MGLLWPKRTYLPNLLIMKSKILRNLSWMQVMVLSFGLMGNGVAHAAAPGSVVINEVAWAGSVDSANDEWIELYNPGGQAVSMAGWKLRDDGVDVYTFPVGSSIAAGGYFLIEDSENVVSNLTADAIYNMSLANSGDTLQLVDETGAAVDTLNGSGGFWYAGSSTSFASMERKVSGDGDVAANFDASTGSGSQASAGGAIVGTPRALNSVSSIPVGASKISAEFVGEGTVGSTVKMLVKADNLTDLFAYGLTLNFDTAVLEYQSAVSKEFLGQNGSVATSFQSALKAGASGQLLVAEARTIDAKVGRTGSGELLEVTFKVIAAPVGNTTSVGFAADSFAASTTADLTVNFQAGNLAVVDGVVAPVTALTAVEGVGRYQIKLAWTASTSAPDHYRVERKDVHGNWVTLAGVTATEFTDQDSVIAGGQIVPKLDYQYRVVAVKGALNSEAVMATAKDNRGVKGDNNRSDLIDGRDLERLARHFSEVDTTAGFDKLIDTTYDGRIDGSDLIDIGASFAQKY